MDIAVALVTIAIAAGIVVYATRLLVKRLRAGDKPASGFLEWLKHLFEAVWGLLMTAFVPGHSLTLVSGAEASLSSLRLYPGERWQNMRLGTSRYNNRSQGDFIKEKNDEKEHILRMRFACVPISEHRI